MSGPISYPKAKIACSCCGGLDRYFKPVLWEGLINEWGLSAEEGAYIDMQQGMSCMSCGSNLRSMALATALMDCFNYQGVFRDFVRRWSSRNLRVLELNGAGHLSPFLSQMRKHKRVDYPEVDMTNMSFPEAAFDVVVHSDTLEHVPDPLSGLRECRRVLRDEGVCCYTVPVVIGRISKTRHNASPSYHGSSEALAPDYLVVTEYGADWWTQAFEAGFRSCRISTVEFPAAQALACIR